MSEGVGHSWKDFFVILEEEHDLDVDNTAHIWLLHVLFLPAINDDLDDWKDMWNCHKLRIRDERDRSPEDMFFFGLIEYGLCGQDDLVRVRAGEMRITAFENNNDGHIRGPQDGDDDDDDDDGEDDLTVQVDENGDEVLVEASLGGAGEPDGADIDIDEVLSEDVRRILLDEMTAQDGSRGAVRGSQEANPFITTNIPRSLSRVSCNPPYCPFNGQQLGELILFLAPRVEAVDWEDKDTLFVLWDEGLEYCRTLGGFA